MRSAAAMSLQLLAFLAGDALVGEQHQIGRADDLLLGLAVEDWQPPR